MKKLLISAIMALTLLIPSFAHADTKESYTNTIKFDNKILSVGEFKMNNIWDIPSVYAAQDYINQGYVAQGYHPLDFSDNLMTYLGGHNPGVMSEIAQYAGVGKRVTVWDKNGTKKELEFSRCIEIPRGFYMDPNSDIVSFLDNHMDEREGLVLQYCSTDNYTKLLWILYPVN